MPEVRVGIDVGGTFTDTAMIGADGRLRISKVPSTPADLSAGFVRGLDVLLQREGIAPADVSFLAHGTTVATNAIVQRRLARSALLTTHGFRDILEIGSQQRPRLYDLWQPKQQAVIAHDDCYGIRERIGPEGDEIEPLHIDDVRGAAARIRDDGRVEAVAVVLLFSFLNPAHELRIREILAEELPGLPVTLSCEVAPEVREYVRASTVALNATLLPLAGGYAARLAEVVAGRGVRVPIHLMRSNGGLAAASTAAADSRRARQLRAGGRGDRRRPPRQPRRPRRPPDLRHGRHDCGRSRRSTTRSRPSATAAFNTSTRSTSPRSTCSPSARAAGRSPGSTRSEPSSWDRNLPAQRQDRPVTTRAARSRP